MPGLSKYDGIDFSNYRLSSGFRELFAKFGLTYLDNKDRRKLNDRRNGSDRRKNGDRRKDLILRLQKSFWKWYSETCKLKDDSYVYLNIKELFDLINAISTGFKNLLCYYEKGNQCNNFQVIEECSHKVWDFFKQICFEKLN